MDRSKHIALVAHDNMKRDLVEWVEFNYHTLLRHRLICTGTTGRLIDAAIRQKAGDALPEGFEIQRRWRGATYRIKVENPKGVSKGVESVTVNGKAVSGAIPVQAKGSVNDVVVVMG